MLFYYESLLRQVVALYHVKCYRSGMVFPNDNVTQEETHAPRRIGLWTYEH